jgi:thioredoxin-related protein
MKKMFTFLLWACLCGLGAAWAHDLPDRFDPRRDAAADVAAAIAMAKTQGKRVLVDVGGEWCVWCHVLDRFMAANADVRQLRDEGYVWVKVNWSPENRNEQLLSRWPKIRSYPHLFVLDGAGQVLHSQPSAELEAGKDYDRERMIAFLRRHRRP